MWNKISAIVWKDIRDLLSNKQYVLKLIVSVIISGLFFPILLFLGMKGYFPYTSITQSLPLLQPDQIPPQFQGDVILMTTYYSLQFIGPFLVLLLMVSVSVITSADVIAGERERKTIERLLSLPIKDSELLLGKTLTPLILSLSCGWLMVASFLTSSIILTRISPAWHWVPWALLFVPIAGFFSTSIMLPFALRCKEYREAVQYGGIFSFVPMFLLLLMQIVGINVISEMGIYAASAIFGGVGILFFIFSFLSFNRERMLFE